MVTEYAPSVYIYIH